MFKAVDSHVASKVSAGISPGLLLASIPGAVHLCWTICSYNLGISIKPKSNSSGATFQTSSSTSCVTADMTTAGSMQSLSLVSSLGKLMDISELVGRKFSNYSGFFRNDKKKKSSSNSKARKQSSSDSLVRSCHEGDDESTGGLDNKKNSYTIELLQDLQNVKILLPFK